MCIKTHVQRIWAERERERERERIYFLGAPGESILLNSGMGHHQHHDNTCTRKRGEERDRDEGER